MSEGSNEADDGDGKEENGSEEEKEVGEEQEGRPPGLSRIQAPFWDGLSVYQPTLMSGEGTREGLQMGNFY